MWRTRRQTKKHRTKNRPKVILELVFCVLGLSALFFLIFSSKAILTKPELIVPLASLRGSVKGLAEVVNGVSDTDEVEKQLREKNISFLFVTTATDAAYIITLQDNAEVLLGRQDIASQIASLQLISQRLTMEGKRFSRLDLRFDRPVIVLK